MSTDPSPTRKILGDSLGRTIVKLLVVSFLVGLVMSAFNWYPMDVYDAIVDFAVNLWETGFAAFGRFGSYIALGAMVVIPVFIVLRLLNMGKQQ